MAPEAGALDLDRAHRTSYGGFAAKLLPEDRSRYGKPRLAFERLGCLKRQLALRLATIDS
jgi:hypothetical protein